MRLKKASGHMRTDEERNSTRQTELNERVNGTTTIWLGKQRQAEETRQAWWVMKAQHRSLQGRQ